MPPTLLVMTKSIANWLEQLNQLAALDEYTRILPGHGAPSDPSVYAPARAYLKTGLQRYTANDDYPDEQAEFFLDIALQRIYSKP